MNSNNDGIVSGNCTPLSKHPSIVRCNWCRRNFHVENFPGHEKWELENLQKRDQKESEDKPIFKENNEIGVPVTEARPQADAK